MAKRNITLCLPEETLEEVKIIAVKRRRSVSAVMTELLEEHIAEETGYLQAERRFLAMLERGFDLGTGGRISWAREEVHEPRSRLRGYQYEVIGRRGGRIDLRSNRQSLALW